MEAQEAIEKYKNQILNTIIILVALFIAFKIYSNQTQKVQILKEKKEVEISKKTIFEDINKSREKLKIYKDFINRKDISSLINIIGDLARESSVEIVAIKPGEPDKSKFFTRYPFRVGVSAEDYHKLADFIARLENHPDVFSVEALSITINSKGSTLEKETLDADLQVSTVLSENGDFPEK